jgi:two-component system LytT family response regulator
MQTQPIDSLRLRFPHGGRMTVVHPAEITRLEALSNYTRVYLQDHPPVLMAKVLRAYDVLLRPYGFVRIHRSHLVNPEFVTSFDAPGVIRMHDASIVEVSRSRKREVKKTFLKKIIHL